MRKDVDKAYRLIAVILTDLTGNSRKIVKSKDLNSLEVSLFPTLGYFKVSVTLSTDVDNQNYSLIVLAEDKLNIFKRLLLKYRSSSKTKDVDKTKEVADMIRRL